MNKTANFDLTNKVAIITGSSKGIGEAMARALAENGAKGPSSAAASKKPVKQLLNNLKRTVWKQSQLPAMWVMKSSEKHWLKKPLPILAEWIY